MCFGMQLPTEGVCEENRFGLGLPFGASWGPGRWKTESLGGE